MNRIVTIVSLALLWFMAGYICAGSVAVSFGDRPFFSIEAYWIALANVILGLILITIFDATPKGRKMFEDLQNPDQHLTGTSVLFAVLFVMPILFVLVGLFWMGLSWVFRLMGLW